MDLCAGDMFVVLGFSCRSLCEWGFNLCVGIRERGLGFRAWISLFNRPIFLTLFCTPYHTGVIYQHAYKPTSHPSSLHLCCTHLFLLKMLVYSDLFGFPLLAWHPHFKQYCFKSWSYETTDASVSGIQMTLDELRLGWNINLLSLKNKSSNSYTVSQAIL